MRELRLSDIYIFVLNHRNTLEYDLNSPGFCPAAQAACERSRVFHEMETMRYFRGQNSSGTDRYFDYVDGQFADFCEREFQALEPKHCRWEPNPGRYGWASRKLMITREELLKVLDPMVNPNCYRKTTTAE